LSIARIEVFYIMSSVVVFNVKSVRTDIILAVSRVAVDETKSETRA
jgi:hypothetical protein